MEVMTSPQYIAVGEGNQLSSDKDSYASKINGQKVSSVDLCPINMEQGIPTVEFSVDEVNTFTREEGLHQAVIFKFSYGKPEIQDLRRLLPKHFDVKDMCNTCQLEYRHILVRFDLFEDFANVVSKSSGYIKSKGEDFFFRTFPWTMDFNPREETSIAFTWISFPELPANFFAKKSIMSIASVVGKAIAIDKATQDRTRPSMARVKILINLLDKHPKKVKLKIVDKKSGRIVEYDQRIVFDNLPKYCTYCHYQGHDVLSCRRKLDEETEKSSHLIEPDKQIILGKLRGDARDYLNAKNASRQMEKAIPRRASILSLSVSDLQISKANLSNLDDNLTKKLQGDARDFLNRKRNAQGKDVHNQVHRINAVWKQKVIAHDMSEPTQLVESMVIHNKDMLMKNPNMSGSNVSKDNGKEVMQQKVDQAGIPNSHSDVVQQCNSLVSDLMQNESDLKALLRKPSENNVTAGTSLSTAADKTVAEEYVLDPLKFDKNSVSLKTISNEVFEYSMANSITEDGTVSGEKSKNATLSANDQIDIMQKNNINQTEVSANNQKVGQQFHTLTDATFGDMTGGDHHSSIPTIESSQDNSRGSIDLSGQSVKESRQNSSVAQNVTTAEKVTLKEDTLDFPSTNFSSVVVSDQNKGALAEQRSGHSVLESLIYTSPIHGDNMVGSKPIVYAQKNNLVHDPSSMAESDMVSNEHCKLIHKQNAVLDQVSAINVASIDTALTLIPAEDIEGQKDENVNNAQTVNLQDTVTLNHNDQVDSAQQTLPAANSVVNDSTQLAEKNGQQCRQFLSLSTSNWPKSGSEGYDQVNVSEEAHSDKKQEAVLGCPTYTNAAECLMQNMEAHSHTNSDAKTAAHRSGTKHTPYIPKRSKGVKLKVWNDQRDYDDEETWGDGLASFSWEEEDQEDDQEDSDDSVEQICQIKDAKKNQRANAKQSAFPKTSLNHNAPLFVPKKQRETSWEGRMGEDVLIRKLPMRHAKLKQSLQPSVLKPTRLRNKREV